LFPGLALGLLLAMPGHAFLTASNLQGWPGTANLVASRMTVQIGPQWIDVEEEAEVQVVPGWTGGTGQWIVEGTITVPAGTAVAGCMLWNGDTLLMGKLRGKADAQHIFDSLVPPRNPVWARDPLLVEQIDATTYSLKLFPFETGGTRRFRLRYLVPVEAGTTDLSVVPRIALAVAGSRPDNFRLRLRGSVPGLKIVQGSSIWPVAAPSSELVAFGAGADVRLRWPAAGIASIRGHQDSGAWAGDYVAFTGAVPDSILSKVGLRSETVVLWRWIQPKTFLSDCYDYYSGNMDRCLGSDAYNVLSQAEKIQGIAGKVVGDGNRFGLVADEGVEDTARVFPLGDSASASYRKLRAWLSGLDASYLKTRIPAGSAGNGTGIPTNREIANSRQRFRTDMRQVATLYSADSGIVRHLLVVTVGPDESGTSGLEEVAANSLPAGVSVTPTTLLGGGWVYTGYPTYSYVQTASPAAKWPGIDLAGFAATRPGTGHLVSWEGVDLPKVRELYPATLSIPSGTDRITRRVELRRGANGRYQASFNVHASALGKTMTWSLYDEAGDPLSTWTEAPNWIDVGNDSVFPRLWAKSVAPESPVFEDRDLGPIFGVVDRFHSLLATPSDTVGRVRQAALRDSGVPFLTWKDIFPRQGYGLEGELGGGDGGENTGVLRDASKTVLSLAWIASSRTLRIGLEGIGAQGIEIRDLRGRLVGSYSAAQLQGLKSIEWRAPSSLGRGMLLVSVRTAQGLKTSRILMN